MTSRPLAVAVVTFATFTDLIAYSICAPVLPDLASRLGASPTIIGLLFGSFGITVLAVSIPMGRVADAAGRRGPLVVSAVALGVSSILFALSHTLAGLFAARMAQGAADGVMWIAGLALIADLYGPEDRGRVMGYMMSGTSVGVMIGPTLGGWLYEAGGIETPFFVVAGMSLLCAVAFLIVVRSTPPSHDAAPPILSVLTHGDVARCAGLIVVIGMTFAMFEPVLPLYFASAFGLTPSRIGMVFGASALASAIMPFVYGPLVPRFGARPMMTTGLILTALTMPLFTLATGFWSMIPIVFLQSSASSLVITPSLAYMAEVTSFAGVSAYGIGYGVYNAAWALGLLIGPASGGYLFQHLGFNKLVLAWAPMMMVITFLIGGWPRRASARPV
ncbi:MAG TPA: MFS transporter [Vicinamibacterales bacterium]|nr:MFS transporter [Vicinamibacterales bacterium]